MGDVADELALQGLASDYAFGLDTGDGERFAGAFMPDGSLFIHRALDASESSTTTGRQALTQLPTYLTDRYDQTLHFLGQSTYEIEGDRATGLLYCLAHHFRGGMHGGIDYVMHMSYRDSYSRDQHGAWKIAERHGYIQWTESRATNPIGL